LGERRCGKMGVGREKKRNLIEAKEQKKSRRSDVMRLGKRGHTTGLLRHGEQGRAGVGELGNRGFCGILGWNEEVGDGSLSKRHHEAWHISSNVPTDDGRW